MKKTGMKILWTITLVALTVMSVFGLALAVMFQGDGMSGCPFMKGKSSLCPTDLTEHISFWKGIFLALPILLSAFFVACIFVAFQKLYHTALHNHSPSYSIMRYEREHGFLRELHYLSILFSRGILHPKLFS